MTSEIVAYRRRYPVEDPNGFFQIINKKLANVKGDVEWFELGKIISWEDEDSIRVPVTYKTKRAKYTRNASLYVCRSELVELGRKHFLNLAPWYLTRSP